MWAPVTALVSADDRNRLCVAVSEVAESVVFVCGVVEDRSEIFWRLDLPAGRQSFVSIDVINHLVNILAEVTSWWDQEDIAGPPAAIVDDRGCVPLYSTWYAYRQGITKEAIEHECSLAGAFGLGGIIVDDGWQQDAVQNNMGCTGSWQPQRSRVPMPPNMWLRSKNRVCII